MLIAWVPLALLRADACHSSAVLPLEVGFAKDFRGRSHIRGFCEPILFGPMLKKAWLEVGPMWLAASHRCPFSSI